MPYPKNNQLALQLNEYEREPYFLQFFQTTVCFIIHLFCKSCEPEIVLTSDQNYYAQYKVLDWWSTQYSIQSKTTARSQI